MMLNIYLSLLIMVNLVDLCERCFLVFELNYYFFIKCCWCNYLFCDIFG